MTDRISLDDLTSDQYDQLCDQLEALRAVARGYCPDCGRGDAAPTVEDWEAERQRADEAEQRLRNIANGSPRADAVQAEIGEMIAQTHDLRDQLRHAEAALTRIRALADEWDLHAPPPGNRPLTELRAALDGPGHADAQPSRWLHVTISNPDPYTANRAALSIRDFLTAEFADSIGLRIDTDAREWDDRERSAGTSQPEPNPSWNTCPAPVGHGPHPWHDPWPLPHGQDAHCPGRPTPEPSRVPVTAPAGLRDRYAAAVDQVIDDDNLDNLTDFSKRLTDAVLAVRDREIDDLHERLTNQALAATELIGRLGAAEERANQLAGILGAVLSAYPDDLNPDGPAVASRRLPAELVARWRDRLTALRPHETAVAGRGGANGGPAKEAAAEAPNAAETGVDGFDGPSIAECREADRAWSLQKAGE